MQEWLAGWIANARALAGRYEVDPVVFVAIYVGAIPFFWLGSAWLVNSARRRRSVVWPTLFTGFCFVSPYLYVLLFGHGLPWWTYCLIAALLLGFGWQSYRSLRRRIKDSLP
jgi:hypothetical protein